jgi:hypothetical protein
VVSRRCGGWGGSTRLKVSAARQSLTCRRTGLRRSASPRCRRATAGAMLLRDVTGLRRRTDKLFAVFPRLAERQAPLAGTLWAANGPALHCPQADDRPELIIFDEPSLGLSPLFVQEVFKISGVSGRRRGRSCWSSRMSARRCMLPTLAMFWRREESWRPAPYARSGSCAAYFGAH